jgi:hypothetical protein
MRSQKKNGGEGCLFTEELRLLVLYIGIALYAFSVILEIRKKSKGKKYITYTDEAGK